MFKRWFGRGGNGADHRARDQGTGDQPVAAPAPMPIAPEAPDPGGDVAAHPVPPEMAAGGTPSEEVTPVVLSEAAPDGDHTGLDRQGALGNEPPAGPDDAGDPAPDDASDPAPVAEEPAPTGVSPAPTPAEPVPAPADAPDAVPAPEPVPDGMPEPAEPPALDTGTPADEAPVEAPGAGVSPVDRAPAMDVPEEAVPADRASGANAVAPPQAPDQPAEDQAEDVHGGITQPLELPADSPMAGAPALLAQGAIVAERYTIREPITPEQATALLGTAVTAEEGDLYAVDDRDAYERCWSCGGTNNGATQRFCVDCGAQLGRPVVLARTPAPSGAAEEVADHGAYFHPVAPRKQFGRTGMTLEIGAFSAEGPHHPNEDSYWSALAGGCYDSVSKVIGVAALADGMGGYAPGSGLISKVIVGAVGRGIFNLLPEESESEMQTEELEAMVKAAIAQANGKVLDEIRQHGEMGATLVTAVICGETAYIANIGDSRAYYIAPSGAVTQISRDQSLIEQQIAAGLLSPDAVYTAIGNNVILHAIGEENVEEAFDWYEQPLEPGSTLLLCSDGYWKTMEHDVWDAELAARRPSLRMLAQAMVESALARESDDNTTVLLIGIE